MKKIVLLFTIIILGMSCQSQKNLYSANDWQLIEMNGKNIEDSLVKITISFDTNTNKIYGEGGCNNYFGTYKVSKNAIEFGQIASTRKYCSDTQKFEDEYLKTLEGTMKMVNKKSQLSLLKNGKIVLIYKKIETTNK